MTKEKPLKRNIFAQIKQISFRIKEHHKSINHSIYIKKEMLKVKISVAIEIS